MRRPFVCNMTLEIPSFVACSGYSEGSSFDPDPLYVAMASSVYPMPELGMLAYLTLFDRGRGGYRWRSGTGKERGL